MQTDEDLPVSHAQGPPHPPPSEQLGAAAQDKRVWEHPPSRGFPGTHLECTLCPAPAELRGPPAGRTPPSATPSYWPTVSAQQAMCGASADGFWGGGEEECPVGNDTPVGHRSQVLPVNPHPIIKI